MRQKGSILVVVLGLLSILAVIGVAFLTLSSLERSTATSFALQTQMMIAADGALDYAVHQMVTDVWEWDVTGTAEAPVFNFTGNLLTGRLASTPGVFPYSAACETYDYPSTADPWLSGPITGNTAPDNISFAGPVVKRFGVNFGGTTATVDNLGIPVDDPAKNGIWIPDLAAPYDQYLVRASLTILDHNALVNFNAHGSKDTGEEGWEYGDCIGKGYFVSDVLPQGPNPSALLTGELGCWGDDDQPGNPKTGAVLIENPYAGQDSPFTLDEEFELRNLAGTLFNSRLEQIWSIPTYTQRLKTTTVSWTAEVCGDAIPSAQQPNPEHKTTGGGWSAAKVDLNTASADEIYQAILDGHAWDDDDDSKAKLKQFVANILTFRRVESPQTFKIFPITIDGTQCIGAVRQPVFSEATRTGPVLDETDPDDIKRTYTIKVELYNPWPGDYSGHTGGLRTDMQVTFDVNAPHEVLPDNNQKLTNPTAGDTCCSPIVERQVVCHNDLTLRDVLQSIRLHWGRGIMPGWFGKVLNLDLIDNTQVADLETSGRIYRKVDFIDELRGTKNNSPIRVFFVSDWNSGGPPNLGSATQDINLRNTAIPIRFPNCVSDDATGLPVRAAGNSTNNPFKAFARVGDLDQVLRFSPGQDTWWSEPWICTVSRTLRSQENNVKFDWMKDIDKVATGTGTAAAYAANVLSAGGPWNDGIDNDGDKQTDLDDTGLPGGPELRVAGKINLNTALPETLSALASGVVAPGLGSLTANRPLKSPAQILGINSATPGGIEARDLPFTLISNIATVRSDTFSVYGTVQVIDPTTAVNGELPDSGILRTRRFWALVDRSPSLAYPPGDANFIPPRILNFQWLD